MNEILRRSFNDELEKIGVTLPELAITVGLTAAVMTPPILWGAKRHKKRMKKEKKKMEAGLPHQYQET